MNDNPYEAPQEQSQEVKGVERREGRMTWRERMVTRLSLAAIAVFCVGFLVWMVQRLFIGE